MMLDRSMGVPVAPVVQDRLTFRKLSPNCGVEVIGVDLRKPLSKVDLQAINEAWLASGVVLFRRQSLDEEEQMRFAQQFGDAGALVNRSPGRTSIPGIMYISNIRENGQLTGSLPDGEMYFHSDQCYIECPTKATILYAIEVTKEGGHTLFANMFRAWDELPDDLKQRIDGRLAMNVYDYDSNPVTRGSKIKEGVPHFVHPVVRTHPETKQKAIYVNRLITDHIVDMEPAESNEILNALFDHCEQDKFVYEHIWEPGDVIMWDNRSTIHARTDFADTERRQMRRITLAGDRPY